jgi:hypothetical protein
MTSVSLPTESRSFVSTKAQTINIKPKGACPILTRPAAPMESGAISSICNLHLADRKWREKPSPISGRSSGMRVQGLYLLISGSDNNILNGYNNKYFSLSVTITLGGYNKYKNIPISTLVCSGWDCPSA